MGAGGECAHGHAVVGGLCDAPAAEGARGVAADEQGQHDGRREWPGAGAARVDAEAAQVKRPDGIEDEVNVVVGGEPIAEVGREQRRRIPVEVLEA